MTQNDTITFSFGKNWEQFIEQHFSEERVVVAQRHLLDFLGLADLKGKRFVDIGCGSGIHSLAAARAGASVILSFDLDPASVSTTRKMCELYEGPADWKVLSGSVLDKSFMATIEPGDIAYSWGVLHHTGQMWPAVENAATLVRPGGLFYIALYTTDSHTPYWTEVKKAYNRAGSLGKRRMECWYVLRRTILPCLLRFKNPLRRIRAQKDSRGMDYMTDVRDWLGGYPYEAAKIEEVLAFGRDRLGMEMINISTGEACTEYLFTHRGGKG